MIEKETILFINPTSNISLEKDLFPFDCKELINIMQLSAIAKKRNYETKLSSSFLLSEIKEYKPAFLVINTNYFDYEKQLSALKELDGFLDETIVIAHGANFNYNSYSELQKHPMIDIVLRGEIEQAFDEIIQYNDLKKVKGITYRVENKITQTPDREPMGNLNHLVNLDREIIDVNSFKRFDDDKTYAPINLARGCSNNCFFCVDCFLNGSAVQYKDTAFVLEEISECIEKYNISDFYFAADVFNFDNDWVKKLCRLIIESKMKINYVVSTRIELLDFETLQLMKESGCNLIITGIEAADEKVLEKIGKKITLNEITEKNNLINKAGISVFASYILGSPWETRETIEKTYELAKKLNTKYARFYSATALIGSKYYDYILRNRLGEINYEKPYIFPSIRSYGLSQQEIFEYNKKFNKEYYKRAKYIFKKIINSFLK